MIANLQDDIIQKDEEINDLQDELAHMDILVEKLSTEIENLEMEKLYLLKNCI